MKVKTKGVIIKSLKNIDIFLIEVDDEHYIKVRAKLLEELKKSIRITKKLLKDGDIKSLSKPKNKQLQPHLNKLMRTKKIIKQSISDLEEFFK